MLDGFTFSFDHFFEVVALKHQIRDGLFVLSLIPSANLDQNV
jgi:hypothetical protein